MYSLRLEAITSRLDSLYQYYVLSLILHLSCFLFGKQPGLAEFICFYIRCAHAIFNGRSFTCEAQNVALVCVLNGFPRELFLAGSGHNQRSPD